MAYTAKLTPEQREAVIKRVAAGASYGEISEWLLTTHSVTISKQAISKMVKKHRSGQADQAKVVARTHIAKRLTKDLSAFDGHMIRVSRLLRLAAREAERDLTTAAVEKVSKLAAVWQKFDDAKKRAMGLDEPDDKITDLASLLSRIP